MKRKRKKGGKHLLKSKKQAEGVIALAIKGTGYIKVQNYKEDIEIGFNNLNTALNGDTVLVEIYKKRGGRTSGKVIKVLARAKKLFAGVVEKENGLFFLRPDDFKMYADILIPEKLLGGAKEGEKVVVEMETWNNPHRSPEGKIIKVLGKPGNNEVEMHSIALEKGFDPVLPQIVETAAKEMEKIGIKNEDLKGRRDFRKILTFTIDPEDAKDFDDAISFKDMGRNEYEIGIHIADVSNYVKPGSAIDKEAKGRGTSVYLVDRTIPMLPEVLSNNLCSLVPNQDRLTMSAVFVLDKNAKIKSEWFGHTLIHSRKRFTYTEAERSIKDPSGLFHKELSSLNSLAKKLNKERLKKGALSLDQEEIKFILDRDGSPLKVIKKERGDSNKLIEEFMLLANKRVAELLAPKNAKRGEGNGISIYRVHDLPNKEKTADLAFFLQNLGYKVTLQNGIIPSVQINKLLEDLSGKKEKDTVDRAVIRSMAKAIYSTKNIGHYGLAFPFYTHFTSPIRRYPDIVVHRLLSDYLQKKKIGGEKLRECEEISRTSSEQEKKAADAERASIKYKQAEYMSKHVGEVFEGIISGVTEWGFYVEELETKSEGLVKGRDLGDDFYVFNEKKLELLGQKKKKRYRFGDRVKIKVKGVDLERKTIDYILAQR